MSRRRLTPAKLVAFSLLSFLLFLLLLEGGLQLLASLQPDQHVLPEDSAYDPPDPDAFRVIAVGDSWVYGAEAEPDEAFIEVFRRLASRKLDAPVQVYNLGVSATNSSQALVSLHGLLEAAQPDLVVALTGANDGLHDRGVAEAARILGEDVRTVPGLSALAGLRTVRLARLIWVNLLAPEHIESTAAAAATAPAPPEPRPTAVVALPWWDLFVARRWEDALTLLRSTRPPDDAPATLGLQAAWEALLLAHLDEDGAAARANEALELGGDDAAAHEALAVIADRERRGLDAIHHRADAALARGNPFLRELARGRVLLALEAWEPARAWLLSVSAAVPGHLDALLALSRLPPTVRTREVDELLFDGPRGLVSPPEFLRWHLASSGRVDRAVGSLGDPDPDEGFAMRAARAEALALQGDAAEAVAAWLALAREAAREQPGRLDVALGGALLAGATVDEALGAAAPVMSAGISPPSAGPWTSLGIAVANDREGACPAAVAAAQRALDAGLDPEELEARAGPCLPRATTWTLRGMVWERRGVLDRDRIAAGSPAPPVPPAWPAVRTRRWDDLPEATGPDWRALVAAFADRDASALVEAAAAEHASDPAVVDLARAWVLLRAGREKAALLPLARAADATLPMGADLGAAWVREVAAGWGALLANDHPRAQRHLHAAEALAPRQLETLDALERVPEPARTRATREAVDFSPVGEVTATRWVEWQLERGHQSRAELATRWSWAPDLPMAAQLAEARRRIEARRATREAEPDPDLGGATEQARRWLATRANPEAVVTAVDDDPVVRHLDAMARLAESQGAAFVALTYPFPSGHHAQVREAILDGADARGYAVLDLYDAFSREYAPAAWEAMRTPQDHVNAAGYARMGELLTEWAESRGILGEERPVDL